MPDVEEIAELEKIDAQIAYAHSSGYMRGLVSGLVWGCVFVIGIVWVVHRS